MNTIRTSTGFVCTPKQLTPSENQNVTSILTFLSDRIGILYLVSEKSRFGKKYMFILIKFLWGYVSANWVLIPHVCTAGSMLSQVCMHIHKKCLILNAPPVHLRNMRATERERERERERDSARTDTHQHATSSSAAPLYTERARAHTFGIYSHPIQPL